MWFIFGSDLVCIRFRFGTDLDRIRFTALGRLAPGLAGQLGGSSLGSVVGRIFRVDSDMAQFWGPYDKTRRCRQTKPPEV